MGSPFGVGMLAPAGQPARFVGDVPPTGPAPGVAGMTRLLRRKPTATRLVPGRRLALLRRRPAWTSVCLDPQRNRLFRGGHTAPLSHSEGLGGPPDAARAPAGGASPPPCTVVTELLELMAPRVARRGDLRQTHLRVLHPKGAPDPAGHVGSDTPQDAPPGPVRLGGVSCRLCPVAHNGWRAVCRIGHRAAGASGLSRGPCYFRSSGVRYQTLARMCRRCCRPGTHPGRGRPSSRIHSGRPATARPATG